jgi:hypothetical protein
MPINKLKNEVVSQLQLGESPINHAPYVSLENGMQCIPQHYLQYQHNRESVELLVVDIEYWHNFIVLIDEDKSGIYLQIAVIGKDNYPSSNDAVRPDQLSVNSHHPLINSVTHSAINKVVYGRKWRVEKELPTSEIIQTAFLALKTAREHEVRELFRLQHKGALTTPFNNHHDLPVMAKLLTASGTNSPLNTDLASLPLDEQILSINQALAKVSYDSASFAVHNTNSKLAIESRYNGDWLIDIKLLANSDTQLAEITTNKQTHAASKSSPSNVTVVTLIIPRLTINAIYFNLMQALIDLSNKHVAENFSYRGFNRFSTDNSILEIAQLSMGLRQKRGVQQGSFISEFTKKNNQIDAARVPELRPGKLAQKIVKKMSQFDQLQGFIPKISCQ